MAEEPESDDDDLDIDNQMVVDVHMADRPLLYRHFVELLIICAFYK